MNNKKLNIFQLNFDPPLQAHNPDQINLPGFNDQRPIHMACYRGDDRLVKVGVFETFKNLYKIKN